MARTTPQSMTQQGGMKIAKTKITEIFIFLYSYNYYIYSLIEILTLPEII